MASMSTLQPDRKCLPDLDALVARPSPGEAPEPCALVWMSSFWVAFDLGPDDVVGTLDTQRLIGTDLSALQQVGECPAELVEVAGRRGGRILVAATCAHRRSLTHPFEPVHRFEKAH